VESLFRPVSSPDVVGPPDRHSLVRLCSESLAPVVFLPGQRSRPFSTSRTRGGHFHISPTCALCRPVLIAFPFVAAGYYLWLWFHKEEKLSRWMGFVGATMTVLIIFVLPAISASYLLMIDQVKMATGVH